MDRIFLWIDDLRPAPDGWKHARTYDEAIDILLKGNVEAISLDHDLGDTRVPERTGYTIALFLAERATAGIPVPKVIFVHSANPVGRERIMGVIQRYIPDACHPKMTTCGGNDE